MATGVASVEHSVEYGQPMTWPLATVTFGSVPRPRPYGIFQTDLNSKTVAHRQIPLGGGGCHGLEYAEGKLWIVALRLRGILRVDPKTWEPEFLIPFNVPRAHGLAWDNGSIWMVTGNEEGAGLIK
jgi:hypothetical protein